MPWRWRLGAARSDGDPELEGPAPELFPELPRELLAIPLRTETGVVLGPGVWRRPGLVERIRDLPGLGEVRTSPVGGTVGPCGEGWMSLLLLARLPDPCPRPLDQLMAAVQPWLAGPLLARGLSLARGRVEGAWCPGFSDLGVDGRKLVGLGFKLTRRAALVRVIVGLRRPPDSELEALKACHRILGLELDPGRLAWGSDLLGIAELDQERALRLLFGEGPGGAAKIEQ